jgi:hypothetical protein
MTDRRRNRAPMRRSSTPERILSAGLATATCVGVVGLLGARTIEANATSGSEASSEQVDATPVVDPAVASTAAVPLTSGGLTQEDLDAYAAELAKEKDRLDAYRAKLVKTAKKLKRQIASQNAAAAVPAQPSYSGSNSGSSGSSSGSASGSSGSKPAAKPQAQAQPAPAAKPAPAAQPAPAPAPAPAPKPQSNTKSS